MSPGKIAIRCATEQDLDSILQIEQATPAAPHWSRSMYAEMLATKPSAGRVRCVLVAVEQLDAGISGKHVVGFVVASAVMRAGEGSGLPAELEAVAVQDHARRRGIGQALCVAAMEWAGEQGAPSIDLEVRAGNAAAVEMYGRLGFRETGRRPHYYQNPKDDALLFSLNLREGHNSVT